MQSDTAGLSASVFLPVLGSAALAAAIKYSLKKKGGIGISEFTQKDPTRVFLKGWV